MTIKLNLKHVFYKIYFSNLYSKKCLYGKRLKVIKRAPNIRETFLLKFVYAGVISKPKLLFAQRSLR